MTTREKILGFIAVGMVLSAVQLGVNSPRPAPRASAAKPEARRPVAAAPAAKPAAKPETSRVSDVDLLKRLPARARKLAATAPRAADPFAPMVRPSGKPVERPAPAPVVAGKDVFVQGIFLSGHRRLALVDGRIVRPGDIIQGLTVLAVELNGVTCAGKDRTVMLPLQTATRLTSPAP